MSGATAGDSVTFPTRSLLLFVASAVVLRALAVAGSAFFPGDRLVPNLARVLILFLSAAGLVLLNRMFLDRDGFRRDVLGLRPAPAHLWGFLAGAVTITAVVAALFGVLWLLVPFHYVRGTLSAGQLVWHAAEYFSGNWGEELMFRGYLLLIIMRRFGLPSALIVTGVLFGLFHLPGMAGWSALKMVGTSFLGGCLYAYGYLLTRTLWTAAGLHVTGNIVLHHVFGASNQNSLFVPAFERPWPTSYDPGFVVWLVVFLPVIAVAAMLYRRRRCAVPCPSSAVVENI